MKTMFDYTKLTWDELLKKTRNWFNEPKALTEALKRLKNNPADSRPYKVYTALLTQTGTNAPVATVLENTLGGDIVWSRSGVGYFLATLVGAFPNENKVGIPGILPSATARVIGYFNNNDSIEFYTSDYTNTPSDLGFVGQLVEIRVYK